MCPLIHFHQNLSDFLGEKKSSPSPIPSTKPKASMIFSLWGRPDGLVPSLFQTSKYRICIWCKEEVDCISWVHQKYNEVHFKRGWEGWDIFSLSFYIAIFKPTSLFEPVFQPVWIMHGFVSDETPCEKYIRQYCLLDSFGIWSLLDKVYSYI